MKNTPTKFLLLACALSLASPLAAQRADLRFERISFEQGLTQSTVYAILQDRRGFMWFGTQDGLNRYDGYNFVGYKHAHTDSQSLTNNYIQSLFESRDGALWIGTKAGLNRLDPYTEKITRYQHDPQKANSLSGNAVYAIYEDHAGNLWVGTNNGLNRFMRATNTWQRFVHDPNHAQSLSHNRVNAIAEDVAHKLWIGTLGGGLNRFDPSTETFEHFNNDPANPNSLSSNFVLALFFDRNQELWIGTYGGGLNHLAPQTKTFRAFRHDSTNAQSLGDDRVYAICEENANELWVTTLAGGLNRFDRRHGTFARYQHESRRAQSLSANFVRAIWRDRSDNLWLGTDNAGLNKLDLKPQKFDHYYNDPHEAGSLRHNFVNALFEGPDRALWVGTNWGLDKLAHGASTFEHVPLELNEPNDDRIFISALWVEKSGAVWVGTFGPGLLLYQPATGKIKRYKHNPQEAASLANNIVNCIYQSRDGMLWLGTSRGLSALPQGSEKFTTFRHDPQNANSLSQNGVACILEDRAGNMWIGTNAGGLNKFARETQTFTRYQQQAEATTSLSNNTVTALYEDAHGWLWVGTNYGLSRLDPQSGSFENYFEAEGLPNNYINGIGSDENGHLWLSTNNGLSRFNPSAPRGQQFRNYDMSDGLQGPGFYEGAVHQSPTGELFFGGTRGFNRFYPRQVVDNPHAPEIALTSFKIFDKPVALDSAITARHTLQLSHEDNFFSFEFAALDFTHPAKNQYMYQMEGFDANWIHSGTRRYASYTNLDHGAYRFRVKGANHDGVWNDRGATIRIVIAPPFWETWWFLALLLMAGTGALALAYRYRVTRLLEVERLRVRIASDLHDDIGATLTKISLHAELLQESEELHEVQDSLHKIGAMSRELVTTMSDIVWSIDARNDTMGNLLDRMREFAASVLAAKSATFDFTATGLDLQKRLPVDIRQSLYLIFKESVNNIAKHAAEASHVEIQLQNLAEHFNMTIRDDGKNSNSGAKLTGQGLRNMKMRAARIGGDLEFSCKDGCVVSLTAPAFK